MEQSDRQFWQIARSFLIRYNEYSREKGGSPLQLQEFDHVQARLLAQQELKESVITKLMSIQFKCDYHNLVALAFLQDLARWSSEYYEELKQHPAPLECLLTQSLQLLNSQQQFHTIVAKQNELISALLPLPITLGNHEHFRSLYRRLKDVKDYFPAAIREHQKKCFLGAIEESLEQAARIKNIKVVEFIFGNIFNQLETLEETHEFVSARLKVMKKLVKSLWVFHQEILYKLAYLLMKYSYQIPINAHLTGNILPIYQHLQTRLLERPNIAALLLLKHVVINNISVVLKNRGSCIVLEGLLSQLGQLFTPTRLEFYMRNYDWNYLEDGGCQESLTILYEFIENRAYEKRPEYQLVKTYLNRIHIQIKVYLQGLKGIKKDDNKWKFYQLKKKQYMQIVQQMNQKPKKLFKRIEGISNVDIREAAVQRLVRLIKKSSHLENKVMIDVFSTDNKVSAQLFAAYAELILKQCKEHNLQEFIRLFTSNFLITGESQQIARVMDTMTQLYFTRQEESNRVLRSSDATYTFANAILILNTDLHNPKNEEKMSQQNFLKMCKKINEGEDIAVQVLKKTYSNIKKNKINTFRDRGNMLGISVSNWMLICTDYDSIPLHYYEGELQALDENCFKYFVRDVLSSIIDQKETAKLQQLVERFVYEDKVFECQIIEVMRRAVDKKPHLPLHILQKTLQIANFKNSKPSDKLLSYYWLSAQIIQSFPTLLPTNLICEFLVLTWALRAELQDNMYLRQSAEIKRIKQCIRAVNKRQAKKSIMDMFSSFLSFKESDDEQQPLPNQFNRRTNFKSISNNVFDIMRYSEQHRKISLQFLMGYIHKEESKLYEEFVSCLFLTFNLLYLSQGSEEIAEDLFYELLGLKESEITKRLSNLGKKDPKLFNLLINYCKFWILKLLLKDYTSEKLQIKENNNYQYLLIKSLDYLQKIDKQILLDLLKELQNKSSIHPKLYEPLQKSIKKVYKDANSQETQALLQKIKNQGIIQKPNQQEVTKTEQCNSIIKQDQIKSEQPISNQEQPTNGEQENINTEICNKALQGQQQVNEKLQEIKPEIPQQRLQQKEQSIQENKVIQNKQLQISPHKHRVSEQYQCQISKKRSVQDLQAYIDPDAMIDQIDRQIQELHAKKKSEGLISKEEEPTAKQEHKQDIVQQPLKQEQTSQSHEQTKPKQEGTGPNQPHAEESEASPERSDETLSIPVVMF